MAYSAINILRNLIRTLNYVVSTHLEDDNLTILDLENIILSGTITERQRDLRTRETKYVVSGVTLDGSQAQTVAKIGFTGKRTVITAYVL